jgi:hypothetical protein
MLVEKCPPLMHVCVYYRNRWKITKFQFYRELSALSVNIKITRCTSNGNKACSTSLSTTNSMGDVALRIASTATS